MSSWPIRDVTSKVYPLYSRANVGEIFPDPISPLNARATNPIRFDVITSLRSSRR